MFAKVKGARTRPHGLAEMWDAGTANAMPCGSDASGSGEASVVRSRKRVGWPWTVTDDISLVGAARKY